MTPKERAVDLFEKYRAILSWKPDQRGADDDARLAAKVAVDLVLHTARADEHCTSREYWLRVRGELERL